MNNLENYSIEDIIANKLIEHLKYGKLGSDNYRASVMPFFNPDNNANIYSNNILQNFDDIPEKLNRNMKIFYKLIGCRSKEFYIGKWTFLSLDEAIEKYKEKLKDGQDSVFDVAFSYLGLGHIEVVSCDLNSHLLFKRRDGGSNIYDRSLNYKKIIDDGSKNYEKFYFSNWFYNIK